MFLPQCVLNLFYFQLLRKTEKSMQITESDVNVTIVDNTVVRDLFFRFEVVNR